MRFGLRLLPLRGGEIKQQARVNGDSGYEQLSPDLWDLQTQSRRPSSNHSLFRLNVSCSSLDGSS
jgi:hypothetical protein